MPAVTLGTSYFQLVAIKRGYRHASDYLKNLVYSAGGQKARMQYRHAIAVTLRTSYILLEARKRGCFSVTLAVTLRDLVSSSSYKARLLYWHTSCYSSGPCIQLAAIKRGCCGVTLSVTLRDLVSSLQI
jgi:hypothetical protein